MLYSPSRGSIHQRKWPYFCITNSSTSAKFVGKWSFLENYPVCSVYFSLFLTSKKYIVVYMDLLFQYYAHPMFKYYMCVVEVYPLSTTRQLQLCFCILSCLTPSLNFLDQMPWTGCTLVLISVLLQVVHNMVHWTELIPSHNTTSHEICCSN